MTDTEPSREFRLQPSSTILNYIRQFSATEKVVFGVLALILIITALVMAGKVNAMFMTEIPGYGGELREGVIGLPRYINPVLTVTDVDRDISELVYSGLMAYDHGNLVPDLAQSFKISTSGLAYTFTLKPGLHFHDGTPLTAEDVAFTIQKIQDPTLKSPRAADWSHVSVQVISPTEIEFDLKQPYSPFLSITTVGILPKHIWGAFNTDQFNLSKYNIEPIGSGPYRVSSIDRDSGDIPTAYHVTSWNGYYGAKPYIGTISFIFLADSEKILAAIDQGSIDSAASVSSEAAARLATDTAQAYTVISAPLPRIFGVFFNQSQNPIFADINVRQALNMSVDREAIVNLVLNGYGSPIDGPLPSGMITDNVSAIKPDMAAARALLEKNGWQRDPATGIYQKKGLKNSIQKLSFDIYTANTPDLKQTADLVKKSWSTLGAEVDIKIFEPTDLYQNVIRTRKYDALLFGELIGKDRDVYAFWHSSGRVSPGLNVAQYANSKVDKLLDDIRSTNDDTSRRSKYAQLEQLIMADVPAVFIYTPDFIYVVPKTLKNISLSDITTPSDRWNSVDSWYIITEKVWKIFAHN